MSKIAFLGTGLLGSGMVEGMLRRGDVVTAWNRTASKALALVQAGASVARTPADAVRGAERIHVTLSDDAAVDEVIGSVLPSLPAGALLIDHTTTSPAGTIARYARLRDRGVTFLHAPVFMSPDMARQSQGLVLTSAPEAAFDKARAALQQMSADTWYLGDDPARAAAFKLFGNSMLFVITAGLGDVFAMARNLGLSGSDALQVFSRFPVTSVIKTRGEKMSRGDFSATFELTMARKDLRLMVEAAGGQRLTILPAIGDGMDRAIAAGYGQQDLGAIMRDREPSARS